MKRQDTDVTTSVISKKSTLSDYKILRGIGEGAFGDVYLVQHLESGNTFAMKSIDKAFLFKQKKEHHVYQEKLILKNLKSPLVVRLIATFQNDTKLYFVLENLPNGELAKYLRIKG